jgi:hypothetical protein
LAPLPGCGAAAISLFLYNRERRTVIDYLTMHGWDVSAYSAREMYARNGFGISRRR